MIHALPKFEPVMVMVSPGRPPVVSAGSVTLVYDPIVGSGVTVTVTLDVAVPLGPVHERLNVVVVASAPVEVEPLVARAPDQPPEAVHAVVFVDDHASVEDALKLIADGVAVKDVIAGSGITATVTLDVALPPIPLHASVKVVVVASAPVEVEPLVARAPDQPPEAVHAVAFVDDQVRVVLALKSTVLVADVKVMVGTGTVVIVTLEVAVPPAPVHASVKVVVVASAPVDVEPLSARAPLHPPEAVHDVASVDDHVRVVLPPAAIVVDAAFKVVVGATTTVIEPVFDGKLFEVTVTKFVPVATPLGSSTTICVSVHETSVVADVAPNTILLSTESDDGQTPPPQKWLPEMVVVAPTIAVDGVMLVMRGRIVSVGDVVVAPLAVVSVAIAE